MEPTSTKLVDTLRDWKSLGADKKECFRKLIEIFNTEYFAIDKDYRSYPLSLLREIIESRINDKVSVSDIMSVISDIITDDKLIDDLRNTASLYADIKRVSTNDEIIQKRFKHMRIRSMDDDTCRIARSSFNFILMYEVCQKLDTYTITLPEKINLMVEELVYLFNRFDTKFVDNIANKKRIILTVFSYIFAVYSGESIPKDIIHKVIIAAIGKLEASAYLNIRILGKSELYKYAKCLCDQITPDTNENKYVNIIAEYQKSGKINTNFKDMMRELGARVKLTCDIVDVLNLIYLYYIFTDKYKDFEDKTSCKDAIKEFAKGVIYSNRFDDILAISKSYIDYLMEFQYSLKNDVQSDDTEISERALDAIKDITKVVEDIREDIDEYHIKAHATPMTDDKEDDGLGFHGLSEYEKDVLKKFTESVAVFDAMTIDQEAFSQTFGNPEILAECLNTIIDTITKFVIDYPNVINEAEFVNALDGAYKHISTNLFKDDHINPDYITKLSTIKAAQTAISDKNQEEMKSMLVGGPSNITPYKDINITDMHTIEDFNINDINDIKKYLDENQLSMARAIREAECINTSAQDIVQEMKISSYVTLALDRAKKVFDTLNDKQKAAFTTMDRIAHSIETWDDKDERDDARMRIVNGKMLPALSKCFKTVLAVGALSYFVSIYLGIVALVMKFVKAKNAEKKERQAIVDELEVELEMIDKRINHASDNGRTKEERNLRLLKKKLATRYTQIALKNIDKWDGSVVMKTDAEGTVSKYALKDE